jgi:hypothetical protein
VVLFEELLNEIFNGVLLPWLGPCGWVAALLDLPEDPERLSASFVRGPHAKMPKTSLPEDVVVSMLSALALMVR